MTLARLACLSSALACQAPASPEPPASPAPAATPVATAPPPPPAPAAPPPLPDRVVAVGDLHGDSAATLAVLKLAGVVDEQGAWAGGSTVLVQTGDTVDRGPDSKGVLEILQRLQREAPAAGGKVIAVVGNHEAMNMLGDWRYVSPEDLAGFGGEAPRKADFAPTGRFGHWFLENDAVVQLGDTVFAHGGVSARYAPQGAAGLSKAVKAALVGAGPLDVIQDQGPMWYRGYLLNDEPLACAELDQALAAMSARRMVVGHTTQKDGRIAARCGGKLLGIDTGISAHYGSHLAAVQITAGDARALYPTGAEDLPDP